MKYRKKPVIVDATLWISLGDHPDVKDFISTKKEPGYTENGPCGYCGVIFGMHGWVETLEGWHIVCPGDWIITGIKKEKYPCKPDVFEATYEIVQPE